MLTITCPVCGVEGDETDFHYGHEAHIARPATHDPDNVSGAMQRDYLFMRRNPRGLHFERWRCDRGCGKWFHAARDTVTMEFRAFYLITELPPDALQREAKGEWAAFFASGSGRHPSPAPQAEEESPTLPSPASGGG